MGLRNVSEVPKIVNIPQGKVYLLIQYTDIQIIRHHSLQMTHTWEEITITFSKIKTIQANAFKGLKKLRILLLNDNLISHFYCGTFSDLNNLVYISVERNRLTSVFTLTGLKHLDSLILSSNRIAHLDNNSFSPCVHTEINTTVGCKSAKDVYTIDLSDNDLTAIAQNSFRCFENLVILNLNKNKLTEIEDKALEGNTKLTVISLSKNEIKHFTMDSFPEILRRCGIRWKQTYASQVIYVLPNEKSRVPLLA